MPEIKNHIRYTIRLYSSIFKLFLNITRDTNKLLKYRVTQYNITLKYLGIQSSEIENSNQYLTGKNEFL